MGVSILVPSCGRPSLQRTLTSITPQLVAGDELLVDVNADGDWGGAARNRMMRKVAPGNGMLFMDDDDWYLPDGIGIAREAFLREPEAVHMFRCRFVGGGLLWRVPELVVNNVSTQNFLVPQSAAASARWGQRYAGDFDFVEAAAKGRRVVWHEDVISKRGPALS